MCMGVVFNAMKAYPNNREKDKDKEIGVEEHGKPLGLDLLDFIFWILGHFILYFIATALGRLRCVQARYCKEKT